MKELGTTLGIIAGASLLQACGTSDGSIPRSLNGPLGSKAKQMLYLSPDETVDDLDAASQHSAANFYQHGYNKERHQFDQLNAEEKIIFQLLFNARPVSSYEAERPFSKEYFDLWITYQLLNSFVLAMGDELTTVGSARINTHIEKIRSSIESNQSVQSIMLEYFLNDIFWARFRSPEDNGREVFEIYLGDFRDEIVPPVAKILQNYSFDEDQGTLDKDPFNRNYEAQIINGTALTTPEELYRYVVNHPDFMPNIYKHIVSALYGKPNSKILADLTDSGTNNFRDIYIAVLTHPELEKTNRAKFPEEILLPAVKSLDITLRQWDIRDLIRIANQTNSPPLFSKLQRRVPDWNALNTAQMAELCDSRIPKELWTTDTSDFGRWGISHEQFEKLDLLYSNAPSSLLTHLHYKIWGQHNVTYPERFSDYLENTGTSGKRLVILALQIVTMNYAHYNFQ